MTQKQFKNLVTYWQKILKLQDWDIKAELVDNRKSFASGSETAFGENHYWTRFNKSHIQIMDHNKITKDDFLTEQSNEENTLVHELLHLHFADIMTDENEEQCERVINKLADILIDIKAKK